MEPRWHRKKATSGRLLNFLSNNFPIKQTVIMSNLYHWATNNFLKFAHSCFVAASE